jgi:hypothetical protein
MHGAIVEVNGRQFFVSIRFSKVFIFCTVSGCCPEWLDVLFNSWGI